MILASILGQSPHIYGILKFFANSKPTDDHSDLKVESQLQFCILGIARVAYLTFQMVIKVPLFRNSGYIFPILKDQRNSNNWLSRYPEKVPIVSVWSSKGCIKIFLSFLSIIALIDWSTMTLTNLATLESTVYLSCFCRLNGVEKKMRNYCISQNSCQHNGEQLHLWLEGPLHNVLKDMNIYCM